MNAVCDTGVLVAAIYWRNESRRCSKISYFVGVDAQETNATMLLSGDRNITNGRFLKNGMLLPTTNQPIGWTKEIHDRCGNIALADGSVQSVSNSALRRLVGNTGVATNRLAIP